MRATLANPTAFDATRLRPLLSCWRQALYSVVYGLERREPFALDLEFGKAMHTGFEALDRARIDRPKDVVGWTNAALDAAWAASEHFPREDQIGWDSKKNRKTLLRVFPWYAEQFGPGDVLSTVRLTNGKPAVEVPFSEPILGGRATLVCRPDAIVQLEPWEVFSLERKSTGSAPGDNYDSRWNPDIQISMQAIAGQSLLADSRFKFRGVVLESVHLLVGAVRFSRAFCLRSAGNIAEAKAAIVARIEEALARLGQTKMDAGPEANEKFWPKNEAACGLCRYKKICVADPSARAKVIEDHFQQRAQSWDPLHK